MEHLDKKEKAHPNRFEVLPQYFYRFLCDKSTTEKSLDILKKMDYHPNIKNETSFDHRLERNEELKDLFIFFEYCLNEIKDDLYMECDKLKITQAWANKSTENQNHHWHNHPNSFLSAVFYLTDSPMPTTFAIGDIWSPQKNFSGNLDLNVRSQVAPIYHKEDTVAGNLILFPSVVDHCVDSLHEGMEDRYTISFNTFPEGTIGSYGSLAGLTIKVDNS